MATSANSLLYCSSFVIVLICIATVCPARNDGVGVTCGKRKINLQQLVTHGYTTKPGEFPWHAALFMLSGRQKSYICGGSLVNELSIVTAAHCVVDPSTSQVLAPASLYVQLGKFKLNLHGDTVQEHAVLQIITHTNFQPSTSKFDIAVVQLATQVKFTDYIQPICVFPQPPPNYGGEASDKGTVVGWGYTEFDALSDALKGTTIPLISYTKCLESNPDLFDRTLYDGMFCAGHTNGTNVCNGDSGGGLFFNRNNVWYLIGIVSFTAAREEESNLCSTNDYTGFTKVSAFEEFLVKNCGLVAPTQADATDQHGTGVGNGRRQKHLHASNFYVNEKVNWYQAADYCRSLRMHLAEIKSPEDNAKVKDIVRQGGMEVDAYGVARNKQYWIGANDLGVHSHFRWLFSGKSVTFTNWRHNEPNEMNYNHNCVAVLGNKQAFWIATNCKGRRQVLCEYYSNKAQH